MKDVAYKDIKNWEVIVCIEKREKKHKLYSTYNTSCSLITTSFELDINLNPCCRLENKN